MFKIWLRRKKSRNQDKRRVLSGYCKKIDKIKLNDGTSNDEHIRRSNRTKNTNPAKLDDFFMGKLTYGNSRHKTDKSINKKGEQNTFITSSHNILEHKQKNTCQLNSQYKSNLVIFHQNIRGLQKKIQMKYYVIFGGKFPHTMFH
jgi:hypothetical protein